VQIADFFLKVDSVDSCAVSGISQGKLIVILRNVSPRGNAGKMAAIAFGEMGSAGGHKTMARAEIPLSALRPELDMDDHDAVARMVIRRINRSRRRPKKQAA